MSVLLGRLPRYTPVLLGKNNTKVGYQNGESRFPSTVSDFTSFDHDSVLSVCLPVSSSENKSLFSRAFVRQSSLSWAGWSVSALCYPARIARKRVHLRLELLRTVWLARLAPKIEESQTHDIGIKIGRDSAMRLVRMSRIIHYALTQA